MVGLVPQFRPISLWLYGYEHHKRAQHAAPLHRPPRSWQEMGWVAGLQGAAIKEPRRSRKPRVDPILRGANAARPTPVRRVACYARFVRGNTQDRLSMASVGTSHGFRRFPGPSARCRGPAWPTCFLYCFFPTDMVDSSIICLSYEYGSVGLKCYVR